MMFAASLRPCRVWIRRCDALVCVAAAGSHAAAGTRPQAHCEDGGGARLGRLGRWHASYGAGMCGRDAQAEIVTRGRATSHCVCASVCCACCWYWG